MYQRIAEINADVYQLGNRHARGTESAIEENTTRDVVFAVPFLITPIVVAGFADDVQALSSVSVYAISTTGFTIVVTKPGGGNAIDRDVSWIATTSGNT